MGTGLQKKISLGAIFKMMGYRPSRAQLLVHKSKARFKIVVGGSRFGKSLCGAVEAIILFFLPNKIIWIIGTQYDLANKEFDWCLYFLARISINGKSLLSSCLVRAGDKGGKVIRSPWGSVIETKSTEKPQLLLGSEIDMAILSETSQHKKSVYERYIRRALGPRKGKLVAPSTPNGDGGLLAYLYEIAQKGTKGWECWLFSVLDNPTYDRQEYDLAKQELNGKVFAEQYDGKFVSRRGLVFDFAKENIIDEIQTDGHPWFTGIFYRPNNPIAVVFVAKIGESYVVFDEICGNIGPVDACKDVLVRARGKTKYLGMFADFWDEAIQKEIKAVGLPCGTNKREKALGKMQSYLRRVQAVQTMVCSGDGRRRILVVEKCTNTIEHFQSCKWPDPKDEEKDEAEREQPLPKYMFFPNAVSYGVCFCSGVSGHDFYG